MVVAAPPTFPDAHVIMEAEKFIFFNVDVSFKALSLELCAIGGIIEELVTANVVKATILTKTRDLFKTSLVSVIEATERSYILSVVHSSNVLLFFLHITLSR